MPKRTIRGSRILITGASSGIGRAAAVAFAQAGAKIVAVARREDRLKNLAEETKSYGGEIVVVAADITQPAERKNALTAAQERFGGLDILVNNAGKGFQGLFEQSDLTHLRSLFELNVFSLLELTQEALPLLKNGVRPMIVNVGSILGKLGIPHRSLYCATKFAIEGFSQSLRAELARYGIDVLVVNPGRTESEFFEHLEGYEADPAWMKPRVVSAGYVAEAMVRAVRQGKKEIAPHPTGKWLALAYRLFPRWVEASLARKK